MDFRTSGSLGKSVQQIQACAEFIFNHVQQMKKSLTEAIDTRPDFKVMEKVVAGKIQFKCFPPVNAATKLPVALSMPGESMEKTKRFICGFTPLLTLTTSCMSCHN